MEGLIGRRRMFDILIIVVLFLFGFVIVTIFYSSIHINIRIIHSIKRKLLIML